MRIFGWIYIIFFSISALFGLAVKSFPVIEKIHYTAPLLFLLSIAVFIFACMDRLKPRKIFIFQTGFSIVTFAYGIVLFMLLVIKLGPEKAGSRELAPQVLGETFTWIGTVNWIYIIVSLLLSAYGFLAYKKAFESIYR